MTNRPEADTYRLVHMGKLEEMMNKGWSEHASSHPRCKGRLLFNFPAEEQRGVCTRQQLKCNTCNYKSNKHNLYTETDTDTHTHRGRRSAQPNITLHVGLTKLPISTTSLRLICSCLLIPPPSVSGCQKTSNKVADSIVDTNESDMHTKREQLKEINRIRGADSNIINIQSDGMYNNALYSGIGKTPFQPATQVVYTAVEHTTKDKHVIAVSTKNKLCSKKHSIMDSEKCVHNATCSRNIPMAMSIGNEKEWAKDCLLQMKTKNNLEVQYITTDPDTKGFKAASELYAENITSTEPHFLVDTRHLSENQRKFVKNSKSVEIMMPGRTKTERLKLQSKFSNDIGMRCQAESDEAFKLHAGDISKFMHALSYTREAIVACYQGIHSKCKRHSYVCKSLTHNWLCKSCFLNKNFLVAPTEENTHTLRTCVDYRLGPKYCRKLNLTQIHKSAKQ